MSEPELKKEEESAGFCEPPAVQRENTLGVLLRHAREREGLSQHNLAEIIRLRLFYIHALEEEAWDRLPAPVFVKGFIKSYARAVGLDEKEVLGLYQSRAPQEIVPSFPGVCGKQTRFRKAYGLAVVFLILISFLIVYFGRDTGLKSRPQSNPSNPILASDPVLEPVPMLQTEKPADAQPNVNVRALQAERISETSRLSPILAPEPAEKTDMGATPVRVKPKQTPSGEWILKAFARKETWINIYKDQAPAQDYTFMPGDKREWRAQKGFIVIVGNAAGIDFELNGVKYEKLGDSNQVIKLKLPEDFERKENEQ